jgi:rsbT co-antagonist protein RsbR
LLGAEVVLTGIRPEVALTLAGMGADLSSIVIHGTLRSGIVYAMRHHDRTR